MAGDGLTIARERIAREKIEKTGELDLGWLGLADLPEEISQLTHLERLWLGLPKEFADGPWAFNVHKSGFGVNNLASGLAPLGALRKLQSLECSRTKGAAKNN